MSITRGHRRAGAITTLKLDPNKGHTNWPASCPDSRKRQQLSGHPQYLPYDSHHAVEGEAHRGAKMPTTEDEVAVNLGRSTYRATPGRENGNGPQKRVEHNPPWTLRHVHDPRPVDRGQIQSGSAPAQPRGPPPTAALTRIVMMAMTEAGDEGIAKPGCLRLGAIPMGNCFCGT